jgi:hypothetical protein
MRLSVLCIPLCLFAATAGCERSGTLRVADVTKAQTFSVRARSSSPTGIKIQTRGHIDGTSYVYIHEYAKGTLSGDADWGIYHDWFEQDCKIFFDPGTATSGSLEITYSFD